MLRAETSPATLGSRRDPRPRIVWERDAFPQRPVGPGDGARAHLATSRSQRGFTLRTLWRRGGPAELSLLNPFYFSLLGYVVKNELQALALDILFLFFKHKINVRACTNSHSYIWVPVHMPHPIIVNVFRRLDRHVFETNKAIAFSHRRRTRPHQI